MVAWNFSRALYQKRSCKKEQNRSETGTPQHCSVLPKKCSLLARCPNGSSGQGPLFFLSQMLRGVAQTAKKDDPLVYILVGQAR